MGSDRRGFALRVKPTSAGKPSLNCVDRRLSAVQLRSHA